MKNNDFESFIDKLSTITGLYKDELLEIIPTKITEKEKKDFIEGLLDTDLKNKSELKSILFLKLQVIMNPLLETKTVPEISVSNLNKKQDITTSYTYIGIGEYTERHVFINSKKDCFLASRLPIEAVSNFDYILQGSSTPSKTGRYYFNINNMTIGSARTPDIIYKYIGYDDKTLYFKNKKDKLFAVKVFYNLSDLTRVLKVSRNYLVVTSPWKDFTTLKEIVETSEKVNGELESDLVLSDQLSLVFKGSKDKSMEDSINWLSGDNDSVYFIAISGKRDYSFNESFYENLESSTKGEVCTIYNVVLKIGQENKYTVIPINTSEYQKS